jgi:hypothetical protein
MPITGITEGQYEQFLAHGGRVTVQLDREDFSKDAAFEQGPSIRPLLKSGFELPPTSLIYDESAAAKIYWYGDTWARAITHIYRNGGKIVYRKTDSGKYEATLELPMQGQQGA